MKKIITVVFQKFSVILLAMSLSAAAFIQPAVAGKSEGEIYGKQPYISGELIVKFKSNFSPDEKFLKDHKLSSAERLSGYIDPGAKTNEKLKKMGADRLYLADFSKDLNLENVLEKLNNDPSIEYAEPNYIVSISSTFPNDPNFSKLWGLDNSGQTGGTADADIDAAEAWDVQTGSDGVVIAVIDTGVDYNHPDLAVNIWNNSGEIAANGIDDDGNGFVDDVRGWDFANNDNNPFDDNNHGTHVAGTIGAVGNNGTGIAGVNWRVKIMPIKFLSGGGSGTTANAIKAINYATRMGAHITNNSWGGGGYSQGLRDAISAANGAGILFVAAAGNNESDNDSYPNYPSGYDLPNVIAVAATDHNDQLAYFSNYGAASVDLGAPGVNIYSTIPNNRYASYSGTSMAAPHVAGAAGIIKAQHPELLSSGIKSRLLGGVDILSSLAGKVLSGGRLNIKNSIASSSNMPPVANAGPDRGALVDQILDFDGSLSYDPDGSIASYNWDFGDGISSLEVYASHAYSAAGTYVVTLTVTDNNGATTQDSAIAQISLSDTVTITKAEYSSLNRRLTVEATSTKSPEAVLTVVNFGIMNYDSRRGIYKLVKNGVGNPGSVTVTSSFGGTATANISIKGKK